MRFRQLIQALDRPLLGLLERLTQKLAPPVGHWSRVFLYRCRIDTWDRNEAILQRLLSRHPEGVVRLLDVGGNARELEKILPERFRLTVIDLNRLTLSGQSACADATQLPFGSGLFDAVVCVDTLEHLPEPMRLQLITEMRRVVKPKTGTVLLHFPAQDDENFLGEKYDREFQRAHRRWFRSEDTNTAEHLLHGLPSPWRLRRSGEWGCSVVGRQYGPQWLQYMLLQRIPFVRIIAALWFASFMLNTPPHHGALVEINGGREWRR